MVKALKTQMASENACTYGHHPCGFRARRHAAQ